MKASWKRIEFAGAAAGAAIVPDGRQCRGDAIRRDAEVLRRA
jgi:hypothetical protein